jgi:hypothetical protein
LAFELSNDDPTKINKNEKVKKALR